MTSIVRRAFAGRSLLHRPLIYSRNSRSYASHPEQEVDYDLDNYPKLPDVSRQHLPAKGWQDMTLRRNLGDPLHEQEELYSMWGPDVPPVAPSVARRHLALAALGFVGFGLTVRYVIMPDAPMVRREYPFSGLVTELGGLDENKARLESESEEE